MCQGAPNHAIYVGELSSNGFQEIVELGLKEDARQMPKNKVQNWVLTDPQMSFYAEGLCFILSDFESCDQSSMADITCVVSFEKSAAVCRHDLNFLPSKGEGNHKAGI